MAMDAASLLTLAAACAPQVDTGTALALVQVESAANPWAIGVVGAQLERQPRSRGEALATARALRSQGRNFSIGLAQINIHNLAWLGLTLESALEPCANLAGMQRVLVACFQRATQQRRGDEQQALRMSLSCYYSGNFTTGRHHGYVQRVVTAAARVPRPAPQVFQEKS